MDVTYDREKFEERKIEAVREGSRDKWKVKSDEGVEKGKVHKLKRG